MDAAQSLAGGLLARQFTDGSWPLTLNRGGHVVVPRVGLGDMPRIAIAMLCAGRGRRDKVRRPLPALVGH
jgi:hypothetical protein